MRRGSGKRNSAPPLAPVQNLCREAAPRCAIVESLPRSAAPSRGSGTKCRRGRQSRDWSRVKKKGQRKEKLVIARPVTDVTGRGNPLSFTPHRNILLSQRETDSHVASLLATAAYHDSLICRLVPLGAMTVLFYMLPFLLPIGSLCTLETPSALRATSPKRGSASRQRFYTDASITNGTARRPSPTKSLLCAAVILRLSSARQRFKNRSAGGCGRQSSIIPGKWPRPERSAQAGSHNKA